MTNLPIKMTSNPADAGWFQKCELWTLDQIKAELARFCTHKVVQSADIAAHFGVSERTVFRWAKRIRDSGCTNLRSAAGIGYMWRP